MVCTIKMTRPYRLWDFCGRGNSEPNDTLKEIEYISESITYQWETAISHLFQKEAPKIKRAGTTTAKAKQANEHGEKQEYVRDKQAAH